MPKTVKGGHVYVLLQNIRKMKGGIFGDMKKKLRKNHKAEITCTKNFGQGRDSNPRPSAWQTSKIPNKSLCQVPVEVATCTATNSDYATCGLKRVVARKKNPHFPITLAYRKCKKRRGPFGATKQNQEKSHSAEKNLSEKHQRGDP